MLESWNPQKLPLPQQVGPHACSPATHTEWASPRRGPMTAAPAAAATVAPMTLRARRRGIGAASCLERLSNRSVIAVLPRSPVHECLLPAMRRRKHLGQSDDFGS